MKALKFAAFFLILPVLSSFAGGKKDSEKQKIDTPKQKDMPKWVKTPSENYPDDRYIVAVGNGSARTDAENDAVTSISKVLNQSISAKESLQSTVSTGGSENAKFDTSVQTSTSLRDISGISIKENWTDNSGYEYALAVLDRTQTGQYYRDKIEENGKKVQELLDSLESGTLAGCRNADKAYQIARDNEYYLELLSIIKPVYRKTLTLPYTSAAAVSQRALKQMETVSVQIRKQDNSDTIFSALSAAINKTGIRVGGDEARYEAICKTSYEPYKMNGSDYEFVHYNVSVDVTEKSTGAIISSWSKSGRQGKLSAQEAIRAAERSVETAIQEEFSNAFFAILQK